MKKDINELPSDIQAQIRALEALPDDQIDTTDVPEVTDWAGAKRGIFYRPVTQGMNGLLDELRRFDALRDEESEGDIISRATLGAIAPTFADSTVFGQLSSRLVTALREFGVERLFRHQADAITRAISGSNVVLQAPTASGKTLAFQVPMLEALSTESNARALMIYPNKALALDQRDQLMKLVNQIPGPPIASWWYDGDTERTYRDLLRQEPPQILITNPEMLNLTFLGHADQWQQFLKNLKWVVVDEMHEYRGYFGSNVSMLLRRFSHHLASLGTHPQFFLSSATCANAREHAENLTGLQFEEVNASDGFRPSRNFYFIKPAIPDYRYWDILQLRTVNAGLACIAQGKAVLAFCPTRNFAESCHRIAMREVEKLRQDGRINIDPQTIRVFRAGLSTDMRHDIQEGIKSGAVRLAFTTNALELGIDIGGLDGVILAGFPDSMMSAWQRIGRAGRRWDSDAFVLYYARNNPMDRFYASNLSSFLEKPLDDLVVNPDNEDLIENHVPSLLFETPDFELDPDILGSGLYEAAAKKLASGARAVRIGQYRPHISINLRGGSGGTFVLKEGSREIGTLSAQQQFREAPQRAIYMHGGSTYRVEEISYTGSGGEVRLGPVDQFLRTNTHAFTTLTEQDIYDARRWCTGELVVNAYYGKVLIVEALTAVEEVDERTGEVKDRWVPQVNSARFENAHAFWLHQETLTSEAAAGITALQHLLRVGAMFSVPLDTHDMFPHAVMKEQKAYMVESYPGGIGIARKALERWRNMLEVGMRVAESCKCPNGCPNCIVPPRSREELSKTAGLELARTLLSLTEGPHDFGFAHGLWEPAGGA